MRFEFTEEQNQFRAEVRAFLEREVPPEKQAVYGVDTEESYRFSRSLSKKLADKGWLAIGWPKEYGGGGRSQVEQAILNEEMGYRRVPRCGAAGLGVVGPGLRRFGTEEQKQKYLPPIARSEVEYCQGFTEPNAGSDLGSLELRAIRDGDEYVVNGTKMFTTAGLRADYIYLMARTDPEAPKHRGISLFILDAHTPGVTRNPLPYINGTVAAFMHFDNARIPTSCLIGEENRGWYHAMTSLDFERSEVELYSVVKRTFDEFVAFCKTTRYNGKLLWEDPVTKHKLAETRVGMEVWRLLCWRIVWLQSTGVVPNDETSISFLYGVEQRLRFAQLAMQLLGPYGTLLHDSQWAPMMGNIQGLSRESLHMHGGGTTEVHRNIIAGRGLGLPR